MMYKLSLTPIELDDDDLDMYMSSLKEDINNLGIVLKLIPHTNDLIIELKSEADFPSLKSSIKDLLINLQNNSLIPQFKAKLDPVNTK